MGPFLQLFANYNNFFLFVNFYNNFIDERTSQTSSLYDLNAARKGTEPVQFLPAHVEAFNEIKRRLCATPQLAHSNLEAPFTLTPRRSQSAPFSYNAMLLASSA